MSNRGAMELSLSTIVIVVLSVLVLIFGLFFVNKIMCGAINGVDSITEKMKEEIINMFNSYDGIVIKEFSNDVYKGVNYGIAFAVRDDGNFENAEYDIEAVDLGECSFTKSKAEDFIILGGKGEVIFDSNNEYVGLIKINVPDETDNCELRYRIIVADGAKVYDSQDFDVKIHNKKFTQSFCG